MKTAPLTLGDRYSVSLWFWNGIPNGLRENTGRIVSLLGSKNDQHVIVGLSNPGKTAAKLRLSTPADTGQTSITPRTWHHLALTRDGDRTTVYLDGSPEITSESKTALPAGDLSIQLAAASPPDVAFEGKLSEVAVHDRTLSAKEIAQLAHTSPRSP